ncbi:MAG TPA: AAA family ATPase [Gaiellaceae bacterium]|nr:AAA family ATPase [Gaiellaceae bacterium]
MICPSCGQELGEGYRFCPSCGAAQEEAVTPGREERKVVSVVFADLAGSTEQAERLDPEDVRAILSAYHAHLRSELERFGGTVEKFIGDAVMAVFGAPVAHEDDPERAVRAALAIRDWAIEETDDLQVRVAVNTGEALVALDARAAHGEALVAGDVVNTAARLQTAAPLNGVLVDEQTHRATVDAIDYRATAPVEAKGKSEPIAVWEAVGARARIGAGARPASATPLVGRERELALLVQTLERVREERSPQLVTLVGVPGIGKSRLVSELASVVEHYDELVRWREGRSLSYGDGVTFWALAEIVKAEAGIFESDSVEQAEEKLRRTVEQHASDPAETQWLERHLRPLTGVAEDSSARADEVFAAWRRFLEALADERPLVLVFEDLHWADDALLDFIDQLVDRVAAVPLLVLATARPELLQRRAGWGGGKPNAATISLSPLTEAETTQLLEGLIEKPADTDLQEALLARAGGNPLYAEQYARVLVERGDFDELPETVQGIIAARLDALTEDEKLLLQDAAVMGQVFWLGAIEAVGGLARWQAEELLHGLERKEFVRRDRNSSVASESEYSFRHLLIRDVAYAQIPRAVRSGKHRAAATWIDSLGRPEEQAELLAHHYLQALELAEAAGLDSQDLAKPARTALRDAGDRAATLYALDAAERFYDGALRLCPADDPERSTLLFRRAAPISYLGGDPERLMEASDALLEAGRREEAGEAEMLLSRAFWIRGQHELSEAHTQRAAALLEAASPSRSTVMLSLQLASRASISRGEHKASLEHASQALALAEELDWPEGMSNALAYRGSARVGLGDAGGLQDLERSVEIAASAGALGTLSIAYNNLSTHLGILGDLKRGYELRLEGAKVAERIGDVTQTRWFLGVLSEYPYRLGEWDEALRMADEFLAAVDADEPHYISWQVLARRAEIHLARAAEARALADADRALELVAAISDPQARYFTNALCARVFAAARRERAAQLAREVVDDLHRGIGPVFASIALPALASTALQLGLLAELTSALDQHVPNPWIEVVHRYAAGDFIAAADMLATMGSRPDEAEARVHAARQLAADGRDDEAGEQLRQAAAFYRSVGATRYLDEIEPLLTASRASD